MPTCGWAPAVKFSCGGLERQLYFGRKRSRVENQERDGNNREGVIFLRLHIMSRRDRLSGNVNSRFRNFHKFIMFLHSFAFTKPR